MVIKTEKKTVEDANGNITISTKEETYEKEQEPDYIKLYTKMWCEFNQIPLAYRELFLELVMRMNYCNANDLEHSQLVNTGTPWSEAIMKQLGWTSKRMYQKGLKTLVETGALKRISRGVYQVNPNYAGKGNWKFNAKLNQGGIKDLIATFDFRKHSVQTQILWADDDKNSTFNDYWRQGLDVSKFADSAMLKTDVIKKNQEIGLPK